MAFKTYIVSLQQSNICYHPGYAEHYYLCNYLPARVGADRLSKSLLRFKEALAHDLQAWIDCAISELKKLDMPDDIVVMRALGSEETSVNIHFNTALDKLGRSIADAFSGQWMPYLVRKPKHTRPLKSLMSTERRTEIRHAYYLSPDYFDFNDKRILLVDDIVTTGATVVSIIRLIKRYFPASRFKVFTLARAGYESSLNSSLQLTGDAYTWEENTGWMVAEGEAEYNSYKQLSACILNDDFSNG